MSPVFRHCPCFRSETDDVQVLEYSHCSLNDVPSEVFAYERTLEELFLDANQIKDLPRPLFHCHGLRKLVLSDNEIQSIPPAIASLINLETLDISKNGILEIPDNIKGCKCLHVIEASVNPLGKLPEGLTQLISLEELYLNDTFLEYLPANFGRLSKIRILELRENHLKILPKSMVRLTELTRLDIGQNDFTDAPEVVGSLTKLVEFWCDSNNISSLPPCLGGLTNLTYLDASRNQLEEIAPELGCCINLCDITLSTNRLKELPNTFGNLKNITILRLDENCLSALPESIGNLSQLEELIVSYNDLESLPASIGLLRNLHTLIADENLIEELPPEVGSCVRLSILSLRDNRLTFVPDELGHLASLKVLSLSGNMLQFLPFSIAKLPKLQALWLSENQTKPLVPLQSDIDPDTGQRILTCFLLPQVPLEEPRDHGGEREGIDIVKEARQQIKFASDITVEQPGKLVRAPTPYPKELKAHAKHARNYALKLKEGSREGSDEPVVANEEKLTKDKIRMQNFPPEVSTRSDTDTSVELPLAVKAVPKRVMIRKDSQGDASSSDRSSVSPCTDAKTSQSTGVSQKPVKIESTDATSIQDSVSASGGFSKNLGAKSTQLKEKLKREENTDGERGCHSDHEMYLLHREQLESQYGQHDGYFSDWEAVAQKEMSHSNPHAPYPASMSRSFHEEEQVAMRILSTTADGQVPAVHNSSSTYNHPQGLPSRWEKNPQRLSPVAVDFIDNSSDRQEQPDSIEKDHQSRPSPLPNLQLPGTENSMEIFHAPEMQSQPESSLSHGSTEPGRSPLQSQYQHMQNSLSQLPSSSTIPKRPIGVSPPINKRFPLHHLAPLQELPQIMLPPQAPLPRLHAQPLPSTRPRSPRLSSSQQLGFQFVRGPPPPPYPGFPAEVPPKYHNTALSAQDSQVYLPQSKVPPPVMRYPPTTLYHHSLRAMPSQWNVPHYPTYYNESKDRQPLSLAAVHTRSSRPSNPTGLGQNYLPNLQTYSPAPTHMHTIRPVQEVSSHFSTPTTGPHTTLPQGVNETGQQIQVRRYYAPPSTSYRESQETLPEGRLPIGTGPQTGGSESDQHRSQVQSSQQFQRYSPVGNPGLADQLSVTQEEFFSSGNSDGNWKLAVPQTGSYQNRQASCGSVSDKTSPRQSNDMEYCQSGSSMNSFCPSSGSDRPASVRSSLSHPSSRPSSFSSMNSTSPDCSMGQLSGPPHGDPRYCYANGSEGCGNVSSSVQGPSARNLVPSSREVTHYQDKAQSSGPPPLPPKPSFQISGLANGKIQNSQSHALNYRLLPGGTREYSQSQEQQHSEHMENSKHVAERLHDINFSPISVVPFSKNENQEGEPLSCQIKKVTRVVSEGEDASLCSNNGARTINSLKALETQLSPNNGSFNIPSENLVSSSASKQDKNQLSPKSQKKPITWIFGTHKNPQVFPVVITKNPGLGFSIAGGIGSPRNPNKPHDTGIYIVHVLSSGPASAVLKPGDKILQVDGIDLTNLSGEQANAVLQSTGTSVSMMISRE
ncbi:uncharacterized protein LOC143223255 isoform X2 [Tachypleus tridentatus]|uniref:uncharacterized protein LOC143223255 isoform X2 n=1 Tax=Tachypleus tridentatus TaxID=6853 RepID=UPI003FD21BC1